MKDKEEIREFIRKNYAEVALKGSSGFDCFLARNKVGETIFRKPISAWYYFTILGAACL